MEKPASCGDKPTSAKKMGKRKSGKKAGNPVESDSSVIDKKKKAPGGRYSIIEQGMKQFRGRTAAKGSKIPALVKESCTLPPGSEDLRRENETTESTWSPLSPPPTGLYYKEEDIYRPFTDNDGNKVADEDCFHYRTRPIYTYEGKVYEGVKDSEEQSTSSQEGKPSPTDVATTSGNNVDEQSTCKQDQGRKPYTHPRITAPDTKGKGERKRDETTHSRQQERQHGSNKRKKDVVNQSRKKKEETTEYYTCEETDDEQPNSSSDTPQRESDADTVIISSPESDDQDTEPSLTPPSKSNAEVYSVQSTTSNCPPLIDLIEEAGRFGATDYLKKTKSVKASRIPVRQKTTQTDYEESSCHDSDLNSPPPLQYSSRRREEESPVRQESVPKRTKSSTHGPILRRHRTTSMQRTPNLTQQTRLQGFGDLACGHSSMVQPINIIPTPSTSLMSPFTYGRLYHRPDGATCFEPRVPEREERDAEQLATIRRIVYERQLSPPRPHTPEYPPPPVGYPPPTWIPPPGYLPLPWCPPPALPPVPPPPMETRKVLKDPVTQEPRIHVTYVPTETKEPPRPTLGEIFARVRSRQTFIAEQSDDTPPQMVRANAATTPQQMMQIMDSVLSEVKSPTGVEPKTGTHLSHTAQKKGKMMKAVTVAATVASDSKDEWQPLPPTTDDVIQLTPSPDQPKPTKRSVVMIPQPTPVDDSLIVTRSVTRISPRPLSPVYEATNLDQGQCDVTQKRMKSAKKNPEKRGGETTKKSLKSTSTSKTMVSSYDNRPYCGYCNRVGHPSQDCPHRIENSENPEQSEN